MSFNPAARELKINVRKFNETTTHTSKEIRFSLVDPNGLSTNYTMTVQVQAAITATQKEESNNGTRSEGGGSTRSGSSKGNGNRGSGNFHGVSLDNGDQKQSQQAIEELEKIVNLTIKRSSMDQFGLITVEFSHRLEL